MCSPNGGDLALGIIIRHSFCSFKSLQLKFRVSIRVACFRITFYALSLKFSNILYAYGRIKKINKSLGIHCWCLKLSQIFKWLFIRILCVIVCWRVNLAEECWQDLWIHEFYWFLYFESLIIIYAIHYDLKLLFFNIQISFGK